MVNQKCLSDNDRSVLNAIFNPMEIGGDISSDAGYDDDELPVELQDFVEEQTPEVLEAIRIEAEAVSAAELENYEFAIATFQKSIDLAPMRAAPYNNRAQAYRLMGNDEAALADLEEALKLSKSSGRTGCKALCQRGLLRRKHNNDDAAKEDFSNAAKLGSKFARSQLVELNPYAALCNQMLRQAFDKLN